MKEYIEYQENEWWKFHEDGEGMNTVTIIDNDNRLITEETLKELGFEKTDFPHIMEHKRLTAVKNNAKWLVYFTYEDETWKTVDKVKMLIEALKGDKEDE